MGRSDFSVRAVVTGALLAGGVLLAACSSSPSSPSGSPTTGASTTTTAAASGSGTATAQLNSIVNQLDRSASATYSATYQVVDAASGKTQSITFAQSPPKSSVTTASGSFYINGSTILECQGTGSSAKCTSLPSSLSSSVTSITNLFSPNVVSTTLRGLGASAVARSQGVSISTSSATYGGQASSCVTVKGPTAPQGGTYCASNANHVLSYAAFNGNTVTLTAFSANPPATSFSPPAGATVATLPSGL